MQLNEVSYGAAMPIDGYGPGFFRIGGEAREAPLILSPTGVAAWNGYDDSDPLRELSGEIDILLVGTGPETTHVPTAFRDSLEAAGLGVEAMATPQACRTYNVLLGEGRRVAIALLPI